ncbi:MAG: FtsQ-type POTRA domain-containing protein [Chthoniobacterales bacterium]|jgi:cell division septal protein FtsQ
MRFFRSKKIRGKKSPRRRRREHLLEVTATAETERRRRNQKIVLYVGEAIVLLGIVAFAWLGIRALLNNQIFENSRYNVRVVEVATDGVMTREQALAKTGIHEGLNIFSLNLDSAQRALASIPEIKSARVERILPDTVAIEIEARRPVAWVAPHDTGEDPSAMATACLVDKDGVMMKPDKLNPAHVRLPVIYGVPTEQWRPGDQIDLPELRAALELFLRAADKNSPEIALRAADVSKGWCIVAWSDAKTRYTFGTKDMPGQLDRLQRILGYVQQTSRKIATANLMPERNTPVTFQGDPPPAEIIAPAEAPKKTKP